MNRCCEAPLPEHATSGPGREPNAPLEVPIRRAPARVHLHGPPDPAFLEVLGMVPARAAADEGVGRSGQDEHGEQAKEQDHGGSLFRAYVLVKAVFSPIA